MVISARNALNQKSGTAYSPNDEPTCTKLKMKNSSFDSDSDSDSVGQTVDTPYVNEKKC